MVCLEFSVLCAKLSVVRDKVGDFPKLLGAFTAGEITPSPREQLGARCWLKSWNR
jgi:hypothetical protein